MTPTFLQRFRHAMMRMGARVMPSCKEISADVSAAMDGKLPLRKRVSIRLHLMMCDLCRRYEKQLHLLRGGSQHYANPEENEVEEPLSLEAMERLKQSVERSGK
ncbi:MAG: zf-HC2 domain-containing protein [Verrucomicrobiales bacterium]|nr:zf-HC2 domain-containing protein [Verrucomicrobiales bacterium]